jgi:hypothetical protein
MAQAKEAVKAALALGNDVKPTEEPKSIVVKEPKYLNEVAKLSAKNRELEEKLKVFEADQPGTTKIKEAMELYKTDPVAGLAKFIDSDPTKEMERIVEFYLNSDSPAEKEKLENELATKVADLQAKLENKEKQETEEKQALATKAVNEQVTKQLEGMVSKFVDDRQQPLFPIALKAENKDEAFEKAREIGRKLVEGRKLSLEIQDESIIAGIMKDAFEIVESEYQDIAKKYSISQNHTLNEDSGKNQSAKPRISSPNMNNAITKPPVKLTPKVVNPDRNLAIKQAKLEVAEFLRNR